jgi:hypothetical protein
LVEPGRVRKHAKRSLDSNGDGGDIFKPAALLRMPLSGWRSGLVACILTVVSVFLLNLIITIWAVTEFSVTGGLGTIFQGSCEEAKTLSLWIHVLINTLSTLALSSSNYAQQCLMSPTREEVDRAHAQGKWLDIGVPSVRNLWRVQRRRAVLWWFLGLTSVPLHLLWVMIIDTCVAVGIADRNADTIARHSER